VCEAFRRKTVGNTDSWKNDTIASSMKTAISIDDRLLLEADLTARRMGLSHSGLFALAVRVFLRMHRQEQMLARLNKVHATGLEPAEKRLLKGIKTRVRRTVKEGW
jgi:hypothetical protein